MFMTYIRTAYIYTIIDLLFLDSWPTGRVFQVAREVTENVAFFLPKNTNIDQVSLLLLYGPVVTAHPSF